jgi:hypothetical protein
MQVDLVLASDDNYPYAQASIINSVPSGGFCFPFLSGDINRPLGPTPTIYCIYYPKTGDTKWWNWVFADATIKGTGSTLTNGCIGRFKTGIPFKGGINVDISPSYAAQSDPYSKLIINIYPNPCWNGVRIWIFNPQTKMWDLFYPGPGTLNADGNIITIPSISRSYLRQYPNANGPLDLCLATDTCSYLSIAFENRASSCSRPLIITGLCYGRPQ